jgi:LPXTG-motif cell wall-anchored protein
VYVATRIDLNAVLIIVAAIALVTSLAVLAVKRKKQ